MSRITTPKVAIIADWLVTYAGAELVLESIVECFPAADIFTLIDVLPAHQRDWLAGRTIHTSLLHSFPGIKHYYRHLLPLMPQAIESFDLSAYDIIISSSHCVAKGVITGPNQLHVSYVHSPVRYAWDMEHEYLARSGITGIRRLITRWLLHRFRAWDYRSAAGVDHLIANSHFIKRRIHKIYRREADVIHPPIATPDCAPLLTKEPFYLTASRMVPYKRLDLIIRSFASLPDRQLVVIGDGPERKALMQGAPSNVTFLGYQPNDVLYDHMRRAKAFLFAAQEDWGCVVLEALSQGCPVIAYGEGGAYESVPDGCGLLFDEQNEASLCEAIRQYDKQPADPVRCQDYASRYQRAQFQSTFTHYVSKRWDAFQQGIKATRVSL